MNLIIKNGTVINAGGRYVTDVAVSGGKITAVEKDIAPGEHDRQTKIVDASGLLVLPGAVDVHTHFELPIGDIWSADDFFAGTRAAACGGVTTIMDFVTPEKNEGLLEALKKRKKTADAKACIDYGLHMGISGLNDCVLPETAEVKAGLNDRLLAEMAEVKAAGVSSFKVFMTYASRLTVDELRRTLARAREINALMMVHAEDHEALEANRAVFIASGKTDVWHHYLSRPEAVEAKAVEKAVDLAKETGAKLYIVHLACAEGLKAVEIAQREGYPIYAETCPQYLNFTNEVYKRPDGRNFVCSPPMKGEESQSALWESVCQGDGKTGDSGKTGDRPLSYSNGRIRQGSVPCLTAVPCLTVPCLTVAAPIGINTLATDHCPFQTFEKDRGIGDFTKTPNGVMGVENLYPYMLSEANKGRLTFERVIELCSANPARIFGCEAKGAIAEGFDADIVLYDQTKDFTVSQKNMHSEVDYTIWEGTKLRGYPVRVYSRGKLIYKNGEFLGKPGHGRFIAT